eukprot:Anaeramoba_flamelloidesc40605_g1_i2.p5 GENE.c40605_g1_i2~~c40605_g1_i2.p5  ORF type:complete len:102 (-),score=13.17 c40605_g1_i2:23-328(-)
MGDRAEAAQLADHPRQVDAVEHGQLHLHAAQLTVALAAVDLEQVGADVGSSGGQVGNDATLGADFQLQPHHELFLVVLRRGPFQVDGLLGIVSQVAKNKTK